MYPNVHCRSIDSWYSLDTPWTTKRSNQSILKEINPEYSLEDWWWSSNTLAIWCEEPTLWKRPWCWERLKAREVDDRGWDGWMASPTQWTWVWAGSGRWWRTGKPGVLQSMGFPRVGYNLETEHQKMLWAEWCPLNFCIFKSYPPHRPVLQNVTLWGDMVFKEDIKLKQGL